jgi:hypothetical protein
MANEELKPKMLDLGIFDDTRQQIQREGLRLATARELVDIIAESFENPDNDFSQEVIGALKFVYGGMCGCGGQYGIRTSQGILDRSRRRGYIGDGIYTIDNPKVAEDRGSFNIDERDVIRSLKAEDGRVVMIIPGFKTGYLSSKETVGHPLVIALLGVEGARKMATLAESQGFRPYIPEDSNDSTDYPIPREGSVSLCLTGENPKDLGIITTGLHLFKDGPAYAIGFPKVDKRKWQ